MHWTWGDAATIALLAGFVAAVISHRVHHAVVGVALIALLAGARVLRVSQAFAGVGSELVLLVGGMMVVAAGLSNTGVTQLMVSGVQAAAGRPSGRVTERRLLGGLVLAGALSGAFLGDVPAMVMWLPAVTQIARRYGTTAGRLLLPTMFGVLAGSECTLIGTAGNILANGILAETPGQRTFGVFTQAPVGMALVAGVLVLTLVAGPLLLPPRPTHEEAEVDFADLKMYQGEVVVADHPAIAGRRLRDVAPLREFGLRVAAHLPLREAEERRPWFAGRGPGAVGPDTVLQAGDRLLVQGSAEDLLQAQRSGVFALERSAEPASVAAEALVLPESSLAGRTLADLSFRQRYGLDVVAVWRHRGHPLTRLQSLRLRAGDILLLAGPRAAALRLHERLDALLLTERAGSPPRASRRWRALAILGLFVIAAGTGAVDPAVAAMGAAALMVLSGCLSGEEALRALDLPILLLLAGIGPLGTALRGTPLPALVAGALRPLAQAWGPLALWCVLFLVGAVTTQFLSDVATILLWVPVAVQVAGGLHVDARPLALALMIGAQSPVVALGHKVALLVPAAGRYTNRDFLRFGVPAALIILIAGALTAPHFFPFH